MSVPDYVRLARHTLDIDDNGHHGQVGDAPDPIDRAINGIAYYREVITAGTPSVVQAKAFGNGGDSGAISGPHSLDSVPTTGNVVVAILGQRVVAWNDAATEAAWPAGWTTLLGNNFAGVDSHGHVAKAKLVESSADQSITFSASITGSLILAEVTGFGGVLPSVLASAVDDVTDDATPEVPAITPAAGFAALILAAIWKKAAAPDPGPQTLSGYTGLASTAYVGSGNRHRLTAWYRVEDPTTGSYGPVSASSSGDAGDDANIIHLAIGHAVDHVWTPTDKPIDADDATYIETVGTDALRLQLDAQYRVASARLRIACENAGSRTYELWGTNNPDYTTGLTLLGSATFTATGSFTAQDVAFSFPGTTGYRYYVLTGDDETRRIHTLELFSPVLAPVTDHGALTGLGDDDHPQYTTEAEVAALIAAIDHGDLAGLADFDHDQYVRGTHGGLETVQAHGAAGATETIDLANGNWHALTLDANLTLTLSGATASKGCSILVELTQDGTGGWTLTLPASVANKTELEAAYDTTADTVAFLTLITRDGGTTWYGFLAGGAVPASALTIEDEGTPLATAADTLDFVGAGVTASGTGAEKTITIPGVTESDVQNAGRWEVVVSGTAPPVAVSTPDDDDWVYAWVSG